MGFWDAVTNLFRPKPPATPVPAPEPPRTESPTVPATPPTPAPRRVPPAPAASDFLPIAHDDLLAQGREVRRTTNWMWFGRRDLIPPTTDPRTLLIDRGMLMQGLLTAEQLAEMHRIGDAWLPFVDRAQAIQIEAGKAGEAAVLADREARAARKAQKKAEAAERERVRAAGVAERKATDIRFAGVSVSSQLNDQTSDIAKLEAAGLPILHTAADLAAALELTIPRLRWLSYHAETATRIHYVQFEVPKKSGGTRTLSAPHNTLAAAQQWLLANVLYHLPTENAAHGFVPGRSTLTNALPHANRDVVINVDLEAFFPSISFPRVRHLFKRLGYSGQVATLLALLSTECPRRKITVAGVVHYVATGPRGLPQGACTSPAISNQIARKLDRRLQGLAHKLDMTYTRYADDLTFSAAPGFRPKVGYLLARLRHIIGEEGFTLNPKKTRVQRPNARQSVTGLVVNAAPAVPRDLVRRLRSILHRAKTEGLAAQNRDNHPHFRGWVEGMIAYVSMVQPDAGAKLREALEAL